MSDFPPTAGQVYTSSAVKTAAFFGDTLSYDMYGNVNASRTRVSYARTALATDAAVATLRTARTESLEKLRERDGVRRRALCGAHR